MNGKHLLAIALLLSMFSCQTTDISAQFDIDDRAWISFDYYYESYLDDSKSWERHSRAILHYDKSNPVIFLEKYIDDRIGKSYWMDNDKLVWVDCDNYEIACFQNHCSCMHFKALRFALCHSSQNLMLNPKPTIRNCQYGFLCCWGRTNTSELSPRN